MVLLLVLLFFLDFASFQLQPCFFLLLLLSQTLLYLLYRSLNLCSKLRHPQSTRHDCMAAFSQQKMLLRICPIE